MCPDLFHSGECVRCMFWNNLGCIHFAMGKHNLGIFYFKKALQENDHTCAQLGDGNNGQCKQLYSCGINSGYNGFTSKNPKKHLEAPLQPSLHKFYYPANSHCFLNNDQNKEIVLIIIIIIVLVLVIEVCGLSRVTRTLLS